MRSLVFARHRSARSHFTCTTATATASASATATATATAAAALAFLTFLLAEPAHAMCGCMLARPGPTVSSKTARISNTATKVVLVRDAKQERTTVIMANDYDGDVQEFGIVVPVPSVVEKSDVRLVDPGIFVRLENATAPRILKVEEPDPCPVRRLGRGALRAMSESASSKGDGGGAVDDGDATSYGVVAKARFAVGEYDITVLSAEQSTGLLAWLDKNGYAVPREAADVLTSYIKQQSYFLVAKVDASRLKLSGRSFLMPLSVKFTSPKFMLPIRLGMVNSEGPQELLVFAFAGDGGGGAGRIEPTNYRNVKHETDKSIPGFVAGDVDNAFEAMFKTATARHDMRVVFTEWAGKLSAADVVDAGPRRLYAELGGAGVQGLGVRERLQRAIAQCPVPAALSSNERASFEKHSNGKLTWTNGLGGADAEALARCVAEAVRKHGDMLAGEIYGDLTVADPAPRLFATRMHFRYDESRFPEDLVLQVTPDKANVRTKWLARVPWTGPTRCAATPAYFKASEKLLAEEIETYARLSGMSVEAVRARVAAD